MRYKKIMVLAILLVALLTVSAVSAADNATQDIVGANETTDEVISVQENSDENIIGASSGTFTDLANEIAKAGSTLNLNRDYCYNDKTDSMYRYGIKIQKAIEINGNGYTIDGNNKIRAFNIESGNVVLKNIKFINYAAMPTTGEEGYVVGGAIFVDYYSRITGCRVIDCTFLNCHADGLGGAIDWAAPDAYLSGCSFIDCSANCGGAISFDFLSKGSLIDCNFVNCSALGYYDLDYETSVTGSGGAINFAGDNLLLSKCNFIDCSSNEGGAVLWYGNNGAVSDCNFMNCQALGRCDEFKIYDEDNDENYDEYGYVTGYGGAIYFAHGDDNSLSGCSFINCSANDGGAIYWHGGMQRYETKGNGDLSDCSFENCHALSYYDVHYEEYECGNGGAIYWDGSNSNLFRCSFENCSAADGGAVYWQGGYNQEYESDYVNKKYLEFGANGTLLGCSFVNCSAADGGAVYWSGSGGRIVGSDFIDCYSNENGGAVYWKDGYDEDYYYYDDDYENYEIIVYWHGADGALLGCSFVNCSALGCSNKNNGDGEDVIGCGGAIYMQSCNGSVDKSDFKNCRAAVYGGGIYFAGDNCTLINSTFEGNVAKGGSDWYNETPINIINMTKLSTVISVPDLNICYGVTNILRIILKDADDNLIVGEQVRLLFNNEEHIIKTNLEGKALYLIPMDLVPKTYDATAIYDGNTKYDSSSANGRITVRKMSFNLSAVYNKEAKEIVFTLTNEYGTTFKNAPVDVTIGSMKNTYKTASGGQFVVSTADLDDGRYTVTANFKGNSLYNPANTTFDIVVGKYDVDISAVYNVVNRELVAVLTNDFTGKAISNVNVKFDIDGVTTTVKSDSNGRAIFSTADLTSDNVTATISYAGNSKYNPASTSITFSTKADIIISAIYNRANKEIVATLTNNATGKAVSNVNVKVTINGATSTVKSNGKGQVIVSTADLTYDKVTATFSYAGNSKYNPASASLSFDVKTRVIVTDVYAYSDRIVAKLTNGATGKFIANANMIVEINGVKYNVKSDNKGQLTFNTKGLNLPNAYELTISYRGNDRYTASSATVAVDLNKANMMITTNYHADKQKIVATLKNSKTGVVVRNANMIIDLNGVKTTYKSNDQGKITLLTDKFAPGTYVGTVTYPGNARYNSISAAFKVDI